MKLITPKTDFIFKKLFCDEHNQDILLSFLNSILKVNATIIQAELVNKNIMNCHIDSDTFMMQFNIKTDNNILFNLMIYVKNDRTTTVRTEKRIEYLIMEKLLTYDDLKEVKKDIHLFLLDGKKYGSIEKYLTKFIEDNLEFNVPLSQLSEIVEIHAINFSNLLNSENSEILSKDINILNPYQIWIEFFQNPNKKLGELSGILELSKAYNQLSLLSADKENIYLYEEYKRDLDYYIKNTKLNN